MWEATIAIASVWGLVITVVLFYVGMKAGKIDQLEDRLDAKAEKLIDARFAALAADMKSPIVELKSIIEGMRERLKEGKQTFDQHDEQSRLIELKLITSTSDLRNWAIQTFATASELQGLRDALRDVELALASAHAHPGRGRS